MGGAARHGCEIILDPIEYGCVDATLCLSDMYLVLCLTSPCHVRVCLYVITLLAS
jgi:hypothetical protein